LESHEFKDANKGPSTIIVENAQCKKSSEASFDPSV